MRFDYTKHVLAFDAPPPPADVKHAPLDSLAPFLQLVKPTRRRLAMMSMLVTGWLPWGIEWRVPDGFPCLPLISGRRYVMCCGHVMSQKVAQQFVTAGLLEAGPAGAGGRATLVITDLGRRWLSYHWTR